MSAGLDEMRRIIRDAEPPRPSNRLATLGIAEDPLVQKALEALPQAKELLARAKKYMASKGSK